jgi:sodium transport system permease protein
MNSRLPRIVMMWRMELRSLLRDRRAVLVSIVLPAVMTPVMLLASHSMQESRERAAESRTYRYGISGDAAATADSIFAEALAAAPAVGLVLELAESSDPAADLEAGVIDFYIEGRIPPSGRWRGLPVLGIVYREDVESSSIPAEHAAGLLADLREAGRAGLLSTDGIPWDPESTLVSRTDTAPAWRTSGAGIGALATLFLLLFLLSGGAVVAIDSIAGEREKGTLETLLTTSMTSGEIVLGKLATIMTTGVGITLIQASALAVFLGTDLLPVAADFDIRFFPATFPALLLLLLPVALLVSGTMLFISGTSRSAKEAQLYVFPVFLLGLLPALAPLFPGLSARFPAVLVPIAGTSLCVRDVMAGRFDWLAILLSAAATGTAAALTIWRASRIISSESLLVASEPSAPGPALFSRHVPRLFAVMWALSLIVSFQAGPDADIRVLLVVNLLVILLGGSAVMVKRYRLVPSRHLFMNRPTTAQVLLAVPGAVAGIVFGLGVYKLVDHFLPAGGQLDAFARTLAPGSIPDLQTLLFLCILPALCEETAFRGLLLGGLSMRSGKTAAVIVSALFFAVFHVYWFRFVPTAVLGVLLALCTLYTRSLVPAMLWHALNNSLALFSPELLDPAGLDPALYPVSAVVLFLVLLGMKRSAVSAAWSS